MNTQPSLGVRVAVGVVAGIMLLSACEDSTADSTAGAEVSPTQATSSSTSAATTSTTANQETVGALEIGSSFVAARDRHDFEATLALMDPAASMIDFGFWPRTPDEYAGLYSWMEILDWRWNLEDCQTQAIGPPIHVICTFTTENEWSRAQGVDPVHGQLDLLIENDLITSVINDLGPDWRPVFTRWLDWVERIHFQDIEVVFRFDDEGNFTGGPATSSEALALYESFVPEYVEATTNASG